MTPSTNTIDTIRGLGYMVGIAHGDVQTEEDALTLARADAEPGAVIETAGQITTATLQDLANAGKLPATEDRRRALAAKIGDAALEMVTSHVNEKVAFHERAVALAKEMPDVWRVEQWAAGPDEEGVYTPPLILSTLVACKPDGTGWTAEDQEHLDTLADQVAFAERAWQAANPDALAAARTLSAAGKTVERDAGSEVFTVDGKSLTADQVIALAESLTDAAPVAAATSTKQGA
jgi:hypothetical protein